LPDIKELPKGFVSGFECMAFWPKLLTSVCLGLGPDQAKATLLYKTPPPYIQGQTQ
jgi:hypothetical protein